MRRLVSSAFYGAGLWNLKDSNSRILGSSSSISLSEAKEMLVKFEDEIKKKRDENLAVTDISYFTDDYTRWFQSSLHRCKTIKEPFRFTYGNTKNRRVYK